MILAYFQSSRGVVVASKSPVLSIAFHKFQSGRFEIEKGCSVLRVTHQRIVSGNFQDGGALVRRLPAFKTVVAFVVLILFKLPDPRANIYVQSSLKFPMWGVHERSKSPPHPVVPPASGITLIAA